MSLNRSFSAGLFFLLIYTSCVIPTYIGKTTIAEIQTDSDKVKVSKILILCAGSNASRLFLENLSEEIKLTFSKNNILCDFNYVGKIPRGSHLDLHKNLNPKYDSYLVFNPADTAYVNLGKETFIFVAPVGSSSVSGSGQGNQYKENYSIELISTSDSIRKIWEGELKLDFDFGRLDKYQSISKQIFQQIDKKILYK